MNESRPKRKAIASLIYWNSEVEKERIERWIAKLKENGFVDSSTTREYTPEWGSPVWYIP